MSPKFIHLLLLLKAVVTVTAWKYVFKELSLSWINAQKHCRTYYTDLAPISSEFDIYLIDRMRLELERFTWIGLMRTTNSSTGWMWSGGGEVSTFFWRMGYPDNFNNTEDYGVIMPGDYSWNDLSGFVPLHFFCYKVHAIRERLTWYEALQYCRENHDDLASVASETEMMLMERELRKELSSFDIWIGLQFIGGHWLWMDGQPFSFESWATREKPICPDISLACGALQVKGARQEVGQETLVNVTKVVGWNIHDCTKKLHFLCY